MMFHMKHGAIDLTENVSCETFLRMPEVFMGILKIQ